VAGFIGSPAMNFLPVQLLDEGGLQVQLADGTRLAVPRDRWERYAGLKGKKLTMGIRPEHLTETREQEKPGAAHLTANVDVVEPMGMETLVHFFVKGEPMCARVDPLTSARPEQLLPLSADMTMMHLIDDATGRVM
jgi:multiple sugar transport system ATP-binding protein